MKIYNINITNKNNHLDKQRNIEMSAYNKNNNHVLLNPLACDTISFGKKSSNKVPLINNDSNLVYIGKAYGNWRNSTKKEDHDYIFTYLIDFNYLLRNYKTEDASFIENLSSSIEKYLEELTGNCE